MLLTKKTGHRTGAGGSGGFVNSLRRGLAHAVPELSTHENQRVTKALDDAIQAAVNGSKKSEDALKDAQREADRILRRYQK